MVLQQILFICGSALIGGVAVYTVWALVLPRLRRRKKPAPESVVEIETSPPPREPMQLKDPPIVSPVDPIEELKRDLAEMARAQVAVIETLERIEASAPADPVIEALGQLEGRLGGTLADIAGGVSEAISAPGAQEPPADLSEPLGRIEAQLATLAEHAAGPDNAAIIAALSGLTGRLEHVDVGLGSISRRMEEGGDSAPDERLGRIEDALQALSAPTDAPEHDKVLQRVNDMAAEMSSALATLTRAEGKGEVDEDSAALATQLTRIEDNLAALAASRPANAEEGLGEPLGRIEAQLREFAATFEADQQIALSPATLEDLRTHVTSALAARADDQPASDGAQPQVEERLDGILTRLDALAPDRSTGQAAEMMTAISGVQESMVALREQMSSASSAPPGASDETTDARIGVLEQTVAGLAQTVTAQAGMSDRLARISEKLDMVAAADVSKTVIDTLQAELPGMASAVSELVLDTALFRQGSAPAAPSADTPRTHTAPPDPVRQGRGTDVSAAEAALLRARPGLATIIGRQSRKTDGSEP